MVEEGNLRHLIASQQPGWALERPFYTQPGIFDHELERLFFQQWLYTGHESRIPNAGDYFTYQVGQEPLLLIRGDDRQVRAFFNICRHKGSRVCLEPRGTARKLVCPYHQWVYDRDGRLFHARHMPETFDRESFGLHPAQVHVYDGLIFVCLDDSPPPFPAPPRDCLAPYELANAKEAHVATYDVRANWKILVENFMECYHCGGLHPEYTRVMAGAGNSFLFSEEMEAESGRPVEEWAGARSRNPDWGTTDGRGWTQMKSEAHHEGGSIRGHPRPSASICGSSNPQSSRLPFRRGACTQSLDGRPVAPLMGTHRDYGGSMLGLWMGWTVELEANSDHVCTFRFTPLEVERTNVEVSWLVRGDAVEGADYDRQRLIEFWKITGEQDWHICEVVQSGVRSRHYQPGPLSPGERYAAAFLTEYLELMGG